MQRELRDLAKPSSAATDKGKVLNSPTRSKPVMPNLSVDSGDRWNGAIRSDQRALPPSRL